jgi:hypothetical protein
MLVRPVGRDQRPWNKGLLIGQKKPLEPKHVWSIRVRREIAQSWRALVIATTAPRTQMICNSVLVENTLLNSVMDLAPVA